MKPYPGSPLYAVTICKIEPVRAAWSPAYSSALNEQGRPLNPNNDTQLSGYLRLW